MDVRQAVGRHGEDLVARELEERGWEVLDRNWRCARGEIDLIAREADTLVAVEVKTRRTAVCGSGLEAVTPAKVARLRGLLARWLEEHAGRFAGLRIDVVAVELPPSGPARLDHVRGVE